MKAKLEAESIYDPTLSHAPGGWLNKTLAIDYVGLSGTRIQIETLVDDVKEKNAQLDLTYDTLNEYKNQVKIDMENLNIKHHEVHNSQFMHKLIGSPLRLNPGNKTSINSKYSSTKYDQQVISPKNDGRKERYNE